MKNFLFVLVWALIASCAPPKTTNVVLIIVDDLGWKDLGVTGSELYRTPRIDSFASENVRFDHFYADGPVCSPTRAAIMTGKHPARLQITNWIGGTQNGELIQADYKAQLPLQEITVAERFKESGYSTGFIGKWHLGAEGFLPQDQGFDTNIGGHLAGQPASYFWPYKRAKPSPWDVPNLEQGSEGEYLTDRLTTEAVSFLESNQKRPFFLVLSHYAVHTPIQAKPEIESEYQNLLDKNPLCPEVPFDNDPLWSSTRNCQDNAAYAAMVESTDESIGRVLDTLERLHLDDNTAVVFVSDNGGLSSLMLGRNVGPTSNRPLRAGKGYLYEGGIRIPFIIKDPNLRAKGIRTINASTVDIMPTLLDLAGISVDADAASVLDGLSLKPEIQEAGTLQERPLYFHFPHYHGSGNRPSGAIIWEGYKLIEWFETGELELYHLTTDPGEHTNLATNLPEQVKALHAMLRTWRTEVSAKMPTPNPEWTPVN